MNENTFYDMSIQAVKNACEKYWLDKDVSYFMNRLCCEDTPVTGMDCAYEDGFYKIEKASYEGVMQPGNICVVTANLILHDTERIFLFREKVDVTVVCVQMQDEVRFASVHMALSVRKTYSDDNAKRPGFYYRKIMGSLCDLLLEAKPEGRDFSFDEEKYEALFGEKRSFTSMDQWFWHLCENYVVEQDLEKLDLFRESDMEKRALNGDFVFDTTFRIKRGEDEIVWIRMMVVFVLDISEGTIGDLFVMLNDCTVEMTEKLKNLEFARTDYLTKIWNRRYTEELIQKRIDDKKKGIFILMDIDKFKSVNDCYGHLTGDDLLIKISKSVGKCLGEEDVFGRLGGDEFVLWLSGSGDREADKTRIWEIFESTKFRYIEKEVEMDIHCSAGVVFFDEEAVSFEELYVKADKAMYQAKGAGRNTIVIA